MLWDYTATICRPYTPSRQPLNRDRVSQYLATQLLWFRLRDYSNRLNEPLSVDLSEYAKAISEACTYFDGGTTSCNESARALLRMQNAFTLALLSLVADAIEKTIRQKARCRRGPRKYEEE